MKKEFIQLIIDMKDLALKIEKMQSLLEGLIMQIRYSPITE